MARLFLRTVPLFLLLSVFFSIVVTGYVKDDSASLGLPLDTAAYPRQHATDANAGAMSTSPQESCPREHSTEYPYACRAQHWQLCFETSSDCLSFYTGGREDCFNESTHPSGKGFKPGPCYKFENYASADVDTESCHISLYQDDNCQVLLEGTDTAFKGNEKLCWKKLTTDPAIKKSKQEGKLFIFSGSFNVSCPDIPNDCPETLVCEKGCIRMPKQSTWPPR